MTVEARRVDIIPGKPLFETILLLVSDILGFGIAIGIVTLIRFWFFIYPGEDLFDQQVIRTILLLVAFSLVVFAVNDLYPGRGQLSVVELRNVARAILFAYAIIGAFIFIDGKTTSFSRSVYILSGFLAIFLIPIGRFLIRSLIAKYPWWGEPVIIIGLESNVVEISNRLLSCRRLGLRPAMGFILDYSYEKKDSNIPLYPWTYENQAIINQSKIKTNVLAISIDELREQHPRVFHSISLHFKTTIFIMDNEIFGSMVTESMNLNGRPAIKSTQALHHPIKRIAKYTFETLSSLILLPPLSLIGLVIGILVRLDTPGPIFYTQERIGRNRKPFLLYKFRTMVTNSDDVLAEMLKDPKNREEWEEFHIISNDRRITRIGKWIRKFSLDELPQIINILRGEMSLIGPRPLVQAEINEIGNDADLFLKVRPGMTGWWQVNGRNNLSFQERQNLDLYYVLNWSLWLDLFILIKTLYTVFVESDG